MEKQLELTEMLEEKQVEKLNNSNIIKNISYDQTEILHNIGVLYNNGSDQFDADMTASSLGFYEKSSGCAYNIPAGCNSIFRKGKGKSIKPKSLNPLRFGYGDR